MFFTEQSWAGQIVTMLFFLILFIYGPKFYFYKIINELEEVAKLLEGYTARSVDLIVDISKKHGGTKSKETKTTVERAMDFFLIPPVDLDPYGILNKVEHLIDKTEDRFLDIAKKIAPKSDEVWQGNIVSLVKGGIGLNNIAKIVRHYVEFVKKTNNIQMAMLIHMNLVMIKKIAKAQMDGVETISKGKPIGDGIGPLVAANLIKGDRTEEIAKDVISHKTDIDGRTVFVLKAKGPGATLGKLGDAVKKIARENKLTKIITIDASLKLEGERTGKVSEGIGAAIGDPGPEKAKIEDAALKNNIPLEAYAIRMSIEEAISPLASDIGDSVKDAIEMVEESIRRAPEGSTVLVVGVGNTCGIGNNYDSVKGIRLPKRKKEKEKVSMVDEMIKKFVRESAKKQRPQKPKQKKEAQ